jgi:hypothetical protein
MKRMPKENRLSCFQKYDKMKTIFEPAIRKELIERVNKLSVHSPRVFGSMRPEQGLHHINEAFRLYLGEITSPYHGSDLKAAIFKLITFSPIPIPREKGKTAPPLVSEGTYNIESEKTKFAGLLERVASQPSNYKWPVHPFFGKMSADQYGKLGYKHTDHHLQQFGV